MSQGITESAVEHRAIRGIDANLGPRNADSFRADLPPDGKADFVPVRKDLAANTATRGSAKPKPRSHLAGLLRSESQLLANPPC